MLIRELKLNGRLSNGRTQPIGPWSITVAPRQEQLLLHRDGALVAKIVAAPDVFDSSYIYYVTSDDPNTVLIANHYGSGLYTLDCDRAELCLLHRLKRAPDDDNGLYVSGFRDEGDVLLWIYEAGVVAIRSTLNAVLWAHEELNLNDAFDGVVGGVVGYVHDYGRWWGYRIEDGSLVGGP
jgi:hypothetical protein